jgi:cyclase
MLKVRVIPILTFNGFALVKTKKFTQPRMVGNSIQSARVYNHRRVDELLFIDIFATKENRPINYELVGKVINECFMPVGIGGGIKTLEDINHLLRIGADKVVIKSKAINDPDFIRKAADYYGSQCISIAVDVVRDGNGAFKIFNMQGVDLSMLDFIKSMEDSGAGELIINSVERDGMMRGFDIELMQQALSSTRLPVVCVGGGGGLPHYEELFSHSNCEAVGSSSIFHFTQFTPLDIKTTLKKISKPVRI